MPRSRGAEMPQRQSPRGVPQLKTSSSNSDPLHNRPITNRSPKIGDRRSPRGVTSDSVSQKKLGTRIAGLESQLDQAQEELKILKEQLTSVEAAKKEAQQELEKKKTTKHSHPTETGESDKKDRITPHEIANDNHKETDVFEVPVEKVTVEPKVEFSQQTNEDELKTEPVSISIESPAILEQEKPSFDDLALKNDEILSLKAMVEEKEKKLEVFCQENESLKSQLNEATSEISSARVKEREMNLRLSQLVEDLEASNGNVVELNEKMEAVERAKEALESEMKKLRAQTEQWRKAADAAAAVLAGNVERCGSMDKHFGSVFDPPVGGYGGFVCSPGLGDDMDDGFGGGKRKSSGIRMFGDLWKKKGQK